MQAKQNRRDWLVSTPAFLAAAAAAPALARPAPARPEPPAGLFRISLNTSTIRGQNLPLPDEIDLAAEVGYDAIEPWIREIDDHVGKGGTVAELRKRIADRGLTVESSIGFFDWAVDDPERRKKGLDEGRRSMNLVRELGGKRIAAPPTGVTEVEGMSRDVLAERFRAVQDLGDELGVIPQLEVWGFSRTVTTLADAAYITLATGHPRACLLADVYHLYKGGSPFETIGLLSGAAMQVVHLNDYPDIPRSEIKDEHRVYPGDGVAPLAATLKALRACGFQGTVSLELFNRDYWKQDARLVARTGLEKVRAAIAASQA